MVLEAKQKSDDNAYGEVISNGWRSERLQIDVGAERRRVSKENACKSSDLPRSLVVSISAFNQRKPSPWEICVFIFIRVGLNYSFEGRIVL